MKKKLLAVQGPLQFIAGYIAMKWYENINRGSENSESVLLMYDFLMPENIEPEFVNVITKLASLQKWHSIIFISNTDMTEIMKGKYTGCIKKLKIAIGESEFDEIYLARDYCGNGSPLIVNAYPDSSRITYGDSLGLVGNEAIFNNFNWRSPVRSILSLCKKTLLGFLYGSPEKFAFDAAVLTLPQDWSGNYLNYVQLMVPEKSHVVNTLMAIYANLIDLSTYCNSLLKHNNSDNKFLFLLSNLSASGLMSEINEISLYLEIIKQTATKDSIIYIKPHPRSALTVLKAIVERLEDEYQIIVIDHAELLRYPIELWVALLQNCTIIPIFSTSAVNLKYIYDKEVILPLDDYKIATYFYQNQISYVSKLHSMVSQSISRLESWDGRSTLWNGK